MNIDELEIQWRWPGTFHDISRASYKIPGILDSDPRVDMSRTLVMVTRPAAPRTLARQPTQNIEDFTSL